ncbi:S8 family serine peptidase [Phytoactinopolyspora halotolerans]|uniref:S8 family serine peptidase n=1 Tax=Phytoactinopolyspora halotolerans TaxID=1981512 RepID=A0A6L9SE01_9ACTN|nr:S8 family serine peptidase [Phytoactinopolyspora halotolerans]NEE02732.1 S8 family serine peptidase [Phytoactinopolyspora halotolerans]
MDHAPIHARLDSRRRRYTRGRPALTSIAVLMLSISVAVTGSHAAPDPDSGTGRNAGVVQPAPLTPAAAPASASMPGGDPDDTVRITLITGDAVLYRDGGGAVPSITVERDPDSHTGNVDVFTGPDGLYVIPDQAQPLVDADVLDRELFNVEYLAENGYSDADADELPVIVTYEEPPTTRRDGANGAKHPDPETLVRRTSELPATDSEPRGLSSINAAAVDVDKESAEDFWNEVRGESPTGRERATTLSAGIGKVWLDRKVTTFLDDSRAQLGVPQAWEAGYDGSGATVAVLDSGYDQGHPDLTGQVRDAVTFVPGVEVQDGGGHGTHVASTIAGSGAASDGRYAGVAPGADLIVGKVMDDYGNGLSSWIIAGMEWAASNADVVNMSLGSFFPSDGQDPMSEALNTLTAETGTLFVVAAGNMGSGDSTVGSPAAADSALAVAAVDNDDAVADFSSRGPRRGDGALKPEIAAPGNPVVAAWAEGTDPYPGVPVGEHYLAHGGTSMASPHVAGVAAMLVQKHPGWDAEQLKDALMSTSFDAGNELFHQGSGRVDAARATGQGLYATGKVDFAMVDDDAADTRAITYTNTGDADVTLRLVVDVDDDGKPAGDGALTLSAQTVEVPAGGTAKVELVLDPVVSSWGEFTGHIRAEGSDGSEVATAVAYAIDGPSYRLTVDAVDRFGNVPLDGNVIVQDLEDPERFYDSHRLDDSGRAVFDVPPGTYGIHGNVRTSDPGRPGDLYSADVFAMSAAGVDGDRTVTVDARAAVDVTFDVDGENRPLEPTQLTRSIYRWTPDGVFTGFTSLADSAGTDARYGAIPAEGPPVGELSMTALTTLREPLIHAELEAPADDLFTVTPEWSGRFDGTQRLEAVDVGRGRAEDYAGVDATGKVVLVEAGERYVAEQASVASAEGAAAMLVVPDAPGVVSVTVGSDNTLPVIGGTYEDGAKLRERIADGNARIRLTGVEESSYTYTLRAAEDDAIPSDLTYSVDRSELAVIENSFHGEADRLGGDALSVYEAWEGGALRYITNVRQPTVRTDYVTAGPELRQFQQVTSSRGFQALRMNGGETAYEPGERTDLSWFKAPNHPSGYTTLPCNFCRSDAILRFAPSTAGDADPTHAGSGRALTSYTAYRNDERIDRTELLLVPEPATYRIEQVAEATPDDEHLLGTRMHTAWTFRSGAPSELEIEGCRDLLPGANACAALPVIVLGYDLPLDTSNRARAGSAFNFVVRTDRAKGYAGPAQVAGVRVSLSYDDGVTWQEARTIPMPRDHGFRVRANHPKLAGTNGYVSLRVEAWDDAGNSTTQVLERAYALS